MNALVTPLAPLNDVLAYRNERVIDGFVDRIDVPRAEAERIFVETLRWLWYIANTTPTPANPEAHVIDRPLLIIDEMWHTFILYTRDYADFCGQMFGRFIHHDPGPKGDGAFVIETDEQFMARKRPKYIDIHRLLGEDVFLTWYREFPQAYSLSAIHRLRKR